MDDLADYGAHAAPSELTENHEVRVTVQVDRDAPLLAPHGLNTPHAQVVGVEVLGGTVEHMAEENTGQTVLRITPTAERVELCYRYSPTSGQYPDAMFVPHDSRYTRAAQALMDDARDLAEGVTGVERAQAIARAVAEKFTYGHPETRYYEQHDHIPQLGCGLTEGSCVDINTYLIASFRAAGIETGYVTGYFFPREKGNHCEDMHCWVVTRIDGETQEWDIAHFLKMGRRDVGAALNPKPGVRAAVFHSMGLSLPSLGLRDVKLFGEPIWLDGATALPVDAPQIRLHT
ncbi:MAG: transglutaminase domain-containing protein [Pseudomonadota bacterium]